MLAICFIPDAWAWGLVAGRERDDKLWMRNLPSFAYTVKLFISIISAGSQSIGGFSLV